MKPVVSWMGILLLFGVGMDAGARPFTKEAKQLICTAVQGAFDEKIKKKIVSGIPFELMSVVDRDNRTVLRRIIRVKFDLWDEVVSIRENERWIKSLSLKKMRSNFCSFLLDKEFQIEKGDFYRLLLNPMWKGRVHQFRSRMKIRSSNFRLVSINWKEVESELSVDEVLVEKEINP